MLLASSRSHPRRLKFRRHETDSGQCVPHHNPAQLPQRTYRSTRALRGAARSFDTLLQAPGAQLVRWLAKFVSGLLVSVTPYTSVTPHQINNIFSWDLDSALRTHVLSTLPKGRDAYPRSAGGDRSIINFTDSKAQPCIQCTALLHVGPRSYTHSCTVYCIRPRAPVSKLSNSIISR